MSTINTPRKINFQWQARVHQARLNNQFQAEVLSQLQKGYFDIRKWTSDKSGYKNRDDYPDIMSNLETHAGLSGVTTYPKTEYKGILLGLEATVIYPTPAAVLQCLVDYPDLRIYADHLNVLSQQVMGMDADDWKAHMDRYLDASASDPCDETKEKEKRQQLVALVNNRLNPPASTVPAPTVFKSLASSSLSAPVNANPALSAPASTFVPNIAATAPVAAAAPLPPVPNQAVTNVNTQADLFNLLKSLWPDVQKNLASTLQSLFSTVINNQIDPNIDLTIRYSLLVRFLVPNHAPNLLDIHLNTFEQVADIIVDWMVHGRQIIKSSEQAADVLNDLYQTGIFNAAYINIDGNNPFYNSVQMLDGKLIAPGSGINPSEGLVLLANKHHASLLTPNKAYGDMKIEYTPGADFETMVLRGIQIGQSLDFKMSHIDMTTATTYDPTTLDLNLVTKAYDAFSDQLKQNIPTTAKATRAHPYAHTPATTHFLTASSSTPVGMRKDQTQFAPHHREKRDKDWIIHQLDQIEI